MVKVFGPVLFYDLIQMARRSRYLLLRCVYAAALLGVMWLVYLSYFPPYSTGSSTTSAPDQLAQFASAYFSWFMVIQWLLILLLTPAYVAGCVAEEKHRRTLEYILATDLTNREVILGKLASRLANLTLFLLAGLPVLSLTQLFGGVDPELLWCGFAATGLTMLSLGGLSILISVYARRARDGIILTYLVVIVYFALWGVFFFVKMNRLFTGAAGGPTSTEEVIFDYAYDVYSAGNVFNAIYELFEVVVGTGTFGTRLLELLRNYAIFHGTLALLTILLAILRLRRVFVLQTYGRSKTPTVMQRVRKRPAIGQFPMLWKEIISESGFRLGWVGRVLMLLLAAACLLPAAILLWYYFVDFSSYGSYSDFTLSMNIYIRIVGTVVGILIWLAVAVRAATSIGSEKDRQTFESLISSPLTELEILGAKWIGSVASVRWLFALLGLIWLVGVITGGLNIAAIPLVLGSMIIYTAFFASLGMMYAVSTRTTLRAIMWTVGTSLFVGGGHLFCTVSCFTIFLIGRGPGSDWPMFLILGFTPVFVQGASAIHGEEFRGTVDEETVQAVLFSVVGTCAYGMAALLLWVGSVEWFKSTSGRIRLTFSPPKPIDSGPRMDK